MRFIICTIAILTFLIMGCSTEQTRKDGNSKFTQHFEDSLFKISEKQLFSAEVASYRKELKIGSDALGIVIHDANDKDVEGADLEVTAYMPDESSTPVLLYVTEKGGGLYSVKKIDLKRKGEWELRIKIKKGDMEDRVVFYFPDKTRS